MSRVNSLPITLQRILETGESDNTLGVDETEEVGEAPSEVYDSEELTELNNYISQTFTRTEGASRQSNIHGLSDTRNIQNTNSRLRIYTGRNSE